MKLRSIHETDSRVPFSARGVSQFLNNDDGDSEPNPIVMTSKAGGSRLNEIDIEYMKRVNPEMASIMEMHERLQRCVGG